MAFVRSSQQETPCLRETSRRPRGLRSISLPARSVSTGRLPPIGPLLRFRTIRNRPVHDDVPVETFPAHNENLRRPWGRRDVSAGGQAGTDAKALWGDSATFRALLRVT